MKKRIFSFMIVMVMMIFALRMVCFATELKDLGEVPGRYWDNESETETEAESTFVGRVWDFAVENKAALLGLAGDALLLFMTILFRRGVNGALDRLNGNTGTIKKTTSFLENAQAGVNDVVNKMIEGYNGLTETYEKYGEGEQDRSRVSGAILCTNTAILEILMTIYANSKNVPQGIKDIVNIKYANCLKAIGDDEKMIDIVDKLKDAINTDILDGGAEEPETEE